MWSYDKMNKEYLYVNCPRCGKKLFRITYGSSYKKIFIRIRFATLRFTIILLQIICIYTYNVANEHSDASKAFTMRS